MFSEAQMSDTIYHVNREGMIARTAGLIRLLRRDETFLAWRRKATGTQSIAALTANPPSAQPRRDR